MNRQLHMLICVASIHLLAGCRSDYLVQPQIMESARVAAQHGQQVAVSVRRMGDDSTLKAPIYADFSALRIEERTPHQPWRVSARDRSAWVTGGGILLAIGLGSLAGGGYMFTNPPACTGCTSMSRDASSFGNAIFGIGFIAGGILEILAGVTVLGMGSSRVEIPPQEPGFFYVRDLAAAKSALLPLDRDKGGK